MQAINSKSIKSPNSTKPKRVSTLTAWTKTRSKIEKSLSSGIVSTNSANNYSKIILKEVDQSPPDPELAEVLKCEIGVQVDEVEIIDNNREQEQPYEGSDALKIRLPSEQIINQIEKERQQKNTDQLKAHLSETRTFEEHAEKQKIHLTKLNEFLETGTIKKKDYVEKDEKSTHKFNLEAYKRIKQTEDDLLKMFRSM